MTSCVLARAGQARRHAGRASGLLALAHLVVGCAATGPMPTALPDPVDVAPGAPPLRAASPEAVKVGEDLYQVPVGFDADGCLLYQLYSPSRTVTLAISYRSVNGGFTLKRASALCPNEV